MGGGAAGGGASVVVTWKVVRRGAGPLAGVGVSVKSVGTPVRGAKERFGVGGAPLGSLAVATSWFPISGTSDARHWVPCTRAGTPLTVTAVCGLSGVTVPATK